MTKDEIIVLLKEQLQLANEQLQQANTTVSSLTLQVNELIIRIKSLEELLVQKGIAIDKANRQNKALGKLVSGKKSERQEKNPQASMTQEEFDKKKTEQAEKRKARKNNGAKETDLICVSGDLGGAYMGLQLLELLGFPCGSAGKESTCNVGDLGSNPGLGRSPGEGKGCPL